MNIEAIPQQENNEIDIVAQILKEKSIDDPEARDVLITWTEKQEREIELIEDKIEHSLAKIKFERQRSSIYLLSGYSEAAFQSLEDARIIATQEGMDDLAQEIGMEIDVLPPPLP